MAGWVGERDRTHWHARMPDPDHGYIYIISSPRNLYNLGDPRDNIQLQNTDHQAEIRFPQVSLNQVLGQHTDQVPPSFGIPTETGGGKPGAASKKF